MVLADCVTIGVTLSGQTKGPGIGPDSVDATPYWLAGLGYIITCAASQLHRSETSSSSCPLL